MKRRVLIFIVLFFIALNIPCLDAEATRKGRGAQREALKTVSAGIEEPYKSFIVVEAASGKMIEGENIHLKRPPASVVKLMVALVVMEKVARGEIKLTDTVTVSKEASQIGGSQVYLKEGEAFTLEEMMKATLIASGNDAAYAVAEHVGGSKEGFVQLMNEKAKALNMVDSEFHSVHGLPPSKGQEPDLSSSHDLAILGRELLKYPKVLEWTAMKSEPFRDGKFIMNNHNKLLTRMAGVDGLKTGYYRETGFNVVATAQRNGLRFIVVVLGSPKAKTRDDIAAEKFKKAFSQYKLLTIVKKGEVIERDVILDDGKYRKIKGVAGASLQYPVPVDRKGAVQKEISIPSSIKGEIREGQKLGELAVKLDNEQIGKVDIVSPVYVPKANLFTRLIRRIGLNI